MAINKNHEFEELDGVKCAIVEKNAPKERVDFLKPLLELNHFTVIVADTPPPKIAAPPPAFAEATADKPAPPISTDPAIPTSAEATAGTPPPVPIPEPPPPPITFTVGVTDVSFNPTNAIFGRLLKTKEGNVVTLAYWQQKENVAHDEIPYFDNLTN